MFWEMENVFMKTAYPLQTYQHQPKKVIGQECPVTLYKLPMRLVTTLMIEHFKILDLMD